MISILKLWNRWGSGTLSSGYSRDITSQITPFLSTPEIIALVGMRRVGKSTIMYQLIDSLEKQGVLQEAVLHVNFEEPAFAPILSTQLLDDLYRSYREEIFPTGKAYIFFDEIQNVPGWQKWVRARNETEDIKIIITGSSANLMSRELGTVLTGRHIEFYVTTLNLNEHLRFKGIKLPQKTLKTDPPPEIQNVINNAMRWGSMPEIVLSKTTQHKELLLKQYLDDILFKDIAMRHQIRDISMLRSIAVHLLTHTATLCSATRIAKTFDISSDMATKYCSFIAESFLVGFIPFFSLKSAERQRNPQKVYAGDLGFRHIASLSLLEDKGKLTETLAYQQLARQYSGNIFYWKGDQEIDFVIRKGNDIISIVQVAHEITKTETLDRELSALKEGHKRFKHAKSNLVIARNPNASDNRILPLWHLLLNEL